ncbi:hypothetical protein Ae201684P_009253 [Aphanomyces euteiches]|uniref:Uncharacterized protein n=1 Tax=Aphanomyces euteiches TaxID=100861 RepID=A0A6G0WHX3_9STRA|nr:hypothetical protein Ae201684_015051 [Aphanomyces euteiches]KAH9062988.1 hypothetical protein Ae201684P_009253 [Aphanomyces euteiches]
MGVEKSLEEVTWLNENQSFQSRPSDGLALIFSIDGCQAYSAARRTRRTITALSPARQTRAQAVAMLGVVLHDVESQCFSKMSGGEGLIAFKKDKVHWDRVRFRLHSGWHRSRESRSSNRSRSWGSVPREARRCWPCFTTCQKTRAADAGMYPRRVERVWVNLGLKADNHTISRPSGDIDIRPTCL